MIIKGLQRLTLLDFPGRVGCTVFLGGCNLRCPFCHNGGIVRGEGDDISLEELLAFLDLRVGRLQGVCVSGGEPTLYSDLPELLSEIKSRGFEIKLDTNGTNPELLDRLINDGLVDYIAMDIKNSLARYEETAGISSKTKAENSKLIDNIKTSAALLMQGRVDFEFRTTLVRELQDESDMISIGKWLAGGEKYFLQTYRDEGDLIVGGFTSYNKEETEQLLYALREYIPNAEIR